MPSPLALRIVAGLTSPLLLLDLRRPAPARLARPLGRRLYWIRVRVAPDQQPHSYSRDDHAQKDQTQQPDRRGARGSVDLQAEPRAYGDRDRDYESDLAQDRRVRPRSTRGTGFGQGAVSIAEEARTRHAAARSRLQPAAPLEVVRRSDG